MKVSTLGIDLAKNVFQLHGVGCNGQTVLKKKLTRDKFLPFLMQLEPCLWQKMFSSFMVSAATVKLFLRRNSPAINSSLFSCNLNLA
ncbi:hypothetical protein [Yersinia enterocolitica]|uniref:hypothetical protein n=1 Tax=Yersinia enterocolitica TaxID=630 RepID=UPI003BF94376